MTERLDPAALEDPRDQAAYWYERMHADDATQGERDDFAQWLRAGPRHARYYQEAEQVWRLAASLPRHEVRRLGAGAPARVSHARSRRAFVGLGVGMACTAAVTLLVADPLRLRAAPDYQESFSTAHGERRLVALPDDSTVLLNTDTQLAVSLYAHERVVRLVRGEAFFQVDGTQGTPFIVVTDVGSVRVTGTQFNVRHIDQAFAVHVLEGSVEVRTGPWWNRRSASLSPGQATQASHAGDLRLQPRVDVASAVAWREGKVVFRGTPLADAVRELNRYSARRIVLRDAATGDHRVSGVFSVDDPVAFLEALPHVVPVVVQRRADGAVAEILAR